MEEREDLNSILPYLPLVVRSSSLFWPSQAVEILKALASGPDQSHVRSGELLFLAISDLRHSLSLSADPLATSAPQGYALFFDQVIKSTTTLCFSSRRKYIIYNETVFFWCS